MDQLNKQTKTADRTKKLVAAVSDLTDDVRCVFDLFG